MSWSRRGIELVCLVVVTIVAGACGGGGPKVTPIGTEVVVEHTEATTGGSTTQLGVTPLRVRKGTIAELEAGGFDIDVKDRAKTVLYLDMRYANKGTVAVPRTMDVSMEDAAGSLIHSVTVIDLGGEEYTPCPNRNDSKTQLAPGEQYETCELFLVASGNPPARIDFLPHVPGKDVDFVYWSVPAL